MLKRVIGKLKAVNTINAVFQIDADSPQTGDNQMSDTDVTNDGTDNNQNWDLARQHADEMRASGEREGSLKNQNETLYEENVRLTQALKDADESDYEDNSDDEAPVTYEELAQRHIKLEGTVKELYQDNKKLRQTVDGVQQNASVASGQNELAQIASTNEQRLGRNDLTNGVMSLVNDRYKDQDIVNFPDKQRQAWIRQELELEYNRQNIAKPKTSESSFPGVNLGGTGSGQPSGTVKPGTREEVAEQMRKKYSNST
jgi:hypothetical protein